MHHFGRNLLIAIIGVQLMLLPVILIVSRQNQDNRSRASENTTPQDPIAETQGIFNAEETQPIQTSFQADAQAAAPSDVNSYTPVKNNKLNGEVYGFLWYPFVDSDSDKAGSYLQYPYLTTIAYAGLTLKKDGTVNKTNSPYKVWQSARLQKILKDARSTGVKIHPRFATFGTDEVNYLLANDSRRKKAVASIISEVKNSPVPLDGVNIDFEPVPTASRDNFTVFIKELRTGLDKIDPRMEIVVDTFASTATSEAGFDLRALNKYVDAFFVMSFTFVSKNTSEKAGSFNPINSYQKTADAYLAKLPGEKIIMGFPFYTNRWSTQSDSLRAVKKDNGGGGLILYDDARAEAKAYGQKYDTNQQSAYYSYWACDDKPGWRQVYFDDTRAQTAKFTVAKSKGLKGVGFWTFNQDKGSLETWDAIYNVFGDKSKLTAPTPKPGFEELIFTPNKNCKAPPVSKSPTKKPTPISTISKAPTNIPTQIPTTGNTTLNLVIGLQGIGQTGTNTQPTILAGNKNPRKTSAKVDLNIVGTNGTNLKNLSQNLKYDSTLGKYKGTIMATIPDSGIYNIFISSPGYLPKRIDVSLIKGQINTIPATNLSTGDINLDSERNILDYNILLACSIFNTRNKTLCPDGSNLLLVSDLNSDGVVDQTDITLWLQEFRGKN